MFGEHRCTRRYSSTGATTWWSRPRTVHVRRPPGNTHALRPALTGGDQGRDIGDDLRSFIAPGHWENINFFGFINVDIEAELAKLIEGLAATAAHRGQRVRHHLHAPPITPAPGTTPMRP